MVLCLWVWNCCFLTLLLATTLQNSLAHIENGKQLKSAVFVSSKVEMNPGSVSNKFYYNIEFPRGHIVLKNLSAELVDKKGVPVPIDEIYLYHWVAYRYYQRIGVKVPKYTPNLGFHESEIIFPANSEAQRTLADLPDFYGLEVGNPSEIPPGYEEIWTMNIHMIDTRGVVDKSGCTECRCDLYDVTMDECGRPLRPDYVGGLLCCYDEMQCRVREGFQSETREIYMKYTVEWLDWDTHLVPERANILDMTDLWKKPHGASGSQTKHNCLVEYQVESCAETGKVTLTMPTSGTVIYAVAHQHTRGVGSTLYGKDGRIICSSMPTYGNGIEAGNEKGYIVGMSTCYPDTGSDTILNEKTSVVESYPDTGVVGLFYLKVEPETNSFLNVVTYKLIMIFIAIWVVLLFGATIAIDVVRRLFPTTVKQKDHQW